jgi:serine/threonine protein kinase
MLIMEYANEGNLRRCLAEITNNWNQILFLLYEIISGLKSIHKKNLIHYNFHDGNILCSKYDSIYGVFISDYLESYQLAKSFLKEDSIYGILPFMAPEVLKGKPYTQASNIYSFSMFMWEFTSGIPPFNDRAHDIQLALSICKGERPGIVENTPQCYVDLMKKCWDEDPLKRPSASEILNIIEEWIFLPDDMKISEELKKNIMEFINVPIGHNNLIAEPHSQAYYTSHLLDFTSKKLNEILEEFLELNSFESNHNQKNIEQKLLKLEMIAETYYESSQKELKIKQKELKEMHLAYQKIKLELVNLEQNYNNLRLSSAIQIREFAEKENNLQDQIINLQNEKQALTNNLTEQLRQNKLTNQQAQIQINQFKQEKLNLQEKLTQIEANIQDLKSYQEGLIKQKKQLENKLTQSRVNYLLSEGKKVFKYYMPKAYFQVQEFTSKVNDEREKAELKAKSEEIDQLEKKLINEEQIKVQLTQALQIKEDKMNNLKKELINLDEKCIKQLAGKEKELNEIKQEIKKTSASYDNNRKKQILKQVNKFLKAKDDFLTLREETIKKLQKQYEVISTGIATDVIIGEVISIGDKISEMKKFQNILVEYNEVGLFQLDEDYSSLISIIQESKELEVSHKINDILKLNSFDLSKYKIITIATNSCRTQLDSNMMAEDIKSLKRKLDEFKSELRQQKKELKNLVVN